ncbi:MAG: YfdX family protein [Methylocystis sp.]|uniref:YfdX family protein n=1 Tax=Methylocystis sp. TaxID=1911079 RepID=UPI003D14B1C5
MKKLNGLIVVASCLAISASLPAFARAERSAAAVRAKVKDTAVATEAPKDDAAERAMMRLSQDGFSAVRAVRAARIALFNGKPEFVSQLLDSAEASLRAAEKEAPSFTVKVSETINGKSEETSTQSQKIDLIPIDATLALADDYVPTDDKKAHIAKANEHLKKGEQKAAMEELRLAEVALNYTRILMPIEATKKHVDQAVQLLGEHKYYEANLALKAVEDGLTVETVNLIEPTGKGAAAAPQKPAAK